MDSIYLHGSEDVRRAASQMSSAADQMSSAASSIDGTLSAFLRNLENLLYEDREARRLTSKPK